MSKITVEFHEQIDDELRNVVANNPSVGTVEQLSRYSFFKVFEGSTLKGFVAYRVVEALKWEGSYAFIAIVSLEPGWGIKMLSETLHLVPADLAIWIAHDYCNPASAALAMKAGFSREIFQKFDAFEQNARIEKPGYEGALLLSENCPFMD